MVIDNTLTPTGHDFFSEFVEAWHSLEQPGKQRLTIRERPSARGGNLISVEHDNRVLYRVLLEPGRPDYRAVAEHAAIHVAHVVAGNRNPALVLH